MYVLVCKYECVCIYAYVCIYVCGGGLVSKSCLTLATLWTVAHQAPLSIGFSRQEHWSGLPLPSSYFAYKGPYRQSYGFSSSHVYM